MINYLSLCSFLCFLRVSVWETRRAGTRRLSVTEHAENFLHCRMGIIS